MPPTLLWLSLALAAYLLGSLPFGLIISRAHGIDIRQHGSKNIGATNVGRVLGPRAYRLCLTLDMLKGAIPVLAASLLTNTFARLTLAPQDAWGILAVAAAAILGHMFPVYIRFKGGKGVATSFGSLVAIFPILTLPTLFTLLVWILAVRITRYIGISSCIAALVLPLALVAERPILVRLGFLPPESFAHSVSTLAPFLMVASLLSLAVIYKHRANIRRTIAGTELTIDQSKDYRRNNPPQ